MVPRIGDRWEPFYKLQYWLKCISIARLQLQMIPVLGLGEVHCEAFEIGERAMLEGTFMRGSQDHARALIAVS
jgi:hypothetical protein